MVHASVDGGEVQVQFRGEDSCQLQLPGWLPPGQPDMVLQRTSGESLTFNWPLGAASGTKIDTRRFFRWPNYHYNNIAHNLYYLIANKQNPPCGNAGGYRGWEGVQLSLRQHFSPYFCVAYFSVRTFKVAKFFMFFHKISVIAKNSSFRRVQNTSGTVQTLWHQVILIR